MSLPSRIRAAREAAGLTQWDLADALGVTRRTVANYEAGHKSLGIMDLCRIAPVLHTTPYELIHGRRDASTDTLHLPSRATATVFHTPAW